MATIHDHWTEVMKLAERHGLITRSVGGVAILMCHHVQRQRGIFHKVQRMDRPLGPPPFRRPQRGDWVVLGSKPPSEGNAATVTRAARDGTWVDVRWWGDGERTERRRTSDLELI